MTPERLVVGLFLSVRRNLRAVELLTQAAGLPYRCSRIHLGMIAHIVAAAVGLSALVVSSVLAFAVGIAIGLQEARNPAQMGARMLSLRSGSSDRRPPASAVQPLVAPGSTHSHAPGAFASYAPDDPGGWVIISTEVSRVLDEFMFHNRSGCYD